VMSLPNVYCVHRHLKALLSQIDRFQFLFQLPARVRRNISLNEKEKVLRDCEYPHL
jgi:hypothetical protein